MTSSRSLKNSSAKIADVIVENVRTKEEIYSFSLPEGLTPIVRVGMRVFVPFGRGNKLRKGLVVSIKEGEEENLKKVLGIVNPFRIIDENGIKVLLEINKKYYIPIFKFIRSLLPVGKGREGREIVEILDEKWRDRISERAERKLELMHFIEENGGSVPLYTLKKYFPLRIVNELVKMGILSKKLLLSKERAGKIKEREVKLNGERVEDPLSIEKETLILEGITYKKRWELYKKSIINSIQEKKRLKLIFPEKIDAVDFFKFLPEDVRRFGEILTGETKKVDRYRIYSRIEEKNLNFIVGTYFSLFLPLNEDKIIVDRVKYMQLMEELIPKEFETIILRYKETGNKSLVFGSFIPSFPIYYMTKKFKWKKISEKIEFPKLRIVSNPHGVLFTQSINEIIRRNRKKKILLFLPRKGYFSFLYCGECGYVKKCPKCKVPLTYFKEKDNLVCKICGFEESPFDTCPVCGGISMRFANPGTERVKDIITKRFKGRKILELDESVVGKSKRERKALEKEFIESGDIVVGTQMIFPLLRRIKDFVFIFLDVDFLLNFPDYTASEKVFYTIVKVIEEAKVMNGEVIIQTRTPKNILFRSLKEGKPEKFIREEFWTRKEAGYPPYMKYIKLRGAGEDTFKEIEKLRSDKDLIFFSKDEITIKTEDILRFKDLFDKIRNEVVIEIKEF